MGITDNVLGGHGFRMTGSVEMASRSVPPLFREPFARTYSGRRREYRLLMKVLPNCVVVNATGSLAAVVDEVVGNIVDRRLGERAMAREAA